MFERENPMSIEEMIKSLPEDLQKKVLEYIQSLLDKEGKKSGGEPKFDWEGALEDLKTRYTSVELQHKVSEWRIGEM